jgi:uncharacterized repeat protein (TIGR01451 family)
VILVDKPPLPGWVPQPAGAGGVPAAVSGVALGQSVDTGTGDPAVVYNGDRITYTLSLTNGASGVAGGVQLIDVLPDNTLDSVECAEDCVQQVATTTISGSGPGGWIITRSVTSTVSIQWSLDPLNPNATARRTFSARVSCQPDGTRFTNQVYMTSDLGGNSSERDTTVRVRAGASGTNHLSTTPTWCSLEPGVNYLDAGDSAGNGRFDLGLAFIGVTAYQNVDGRLTRLPEIQSGYADSVRWGDLNHDGQAELVASGPAINVGGGFWFTSTNSVYHFTNTTASLINSFQSDDGLYRMALADYDGDGRLDLATSIFWSFGSYGPCKVRLYRNRGANLFADFTDAGNPCLYSSLLAGARGIAWGDYDNNGYPELAVGTNDGGIRIYLNSGSPPYMTDTDVISVDTGLAGSAYDLAWGDYDRDGRLDLAAILPQLQQVRVYRNTTAGFDPGSAILISTASPFGQALDWGDMDGDGWLELVVADDPPKVYQYDPGSGSFSLEATLPAGLVNAPVGGIRVFDYNGDGNLDLAFANSGDAQSLMFTNFAAFLSKTMAPVIGTFKASSVAWGDADGDGYPDLLYGAGPGAFGDSRLYHNRQDGTFQLATTFSNNGYGPQSVAFGDVDGNGSLDVAFGVSGQNQVYLAGSSSWPPSWMYMSNYLGYSVAWGDADADGNLDLLAGNNGPNLLYLNQGSRLASSPAWASSEQDDTRGVAWADVDGDNYPDFAAGNHNGPLRLYHNHKNGTFNLAWSTPYSLDTRSVAWADWDGDGAPELAAGNYGSPILIYDNINGQLSSTPMWTSPVAMNTTSLAWGDWNSDGRPDLAVGNANQPDQVYANLSAPNAPQLVLVWQSAEANATTGVAWGDVDGDGDLDLAISQDGSGKNGVYLNNYVRAAHLTSNFTRAMPLPDNPSYVSVARPGMTGSADFYSSSEILAPATAIQTVTIRYRLFDPDGTRSDTPPDAAGDNIGGTRYEYSLDGGGTWHPASGVASDSEHAEETCRLGVEQAFQWSAGQDHAVSDNARFRVTLFQHMGPLEGATSPTFRAGRSQRATISAISPPFRVRATQCIWPGKPAVSVMPANPNPGQAAAFFGSVVTGSGILTFSWDFGDGSGTAYGQIRTHTYAAASTHLVTLTVRGQACPIAQEVVANALVVVGSGVVTDTSSRVYLPLVMQDVAAGAAGALPASLPAICVDPGCPAQVRDVQGTRQGGATALTWSANPASDQVTGYRIYAGALGEGGWPRRLADLTADVTGFQDTLSACGTLYYVTALNALGESAPSIVSYVSRCE